MDECVYISTEMNAGVRGELDDAFVAVGQELSSQTRHGHIGH